MWWTCDKITLLLPTDCHVSQSEDGSMQLTLTIKFWWKVLPQVQEETGVALRKEGKAERSNSLASYTHKHGNINLLDSMPVFTLLAPSGIFLTQELNPHFLHWWVDSLLEPTGYICPYIYSTYMLTLILRTTCNVVSQEMFSIQMLINLRDRWRSKGCQTRNYSLVNSALIKLGSPH